jgi:hypothetical protein
MINLIQQSNIHYHYKKSWYYLIRKLDKKLVILTYGKFHHLVILINSIWPCSTWLMVFLINHKMVFLTSQIVQTNWQPKHFNWKINPNFK